MAEIDGHPTPAHPPADDGNSIFDKLSGTAEAATKVANRNAELAQQATAAKTHAGGPGFAFDYDQLMSIAGRWGDLADGYTYDARTCWVLKQTQPPGDEYASIKNVESVHETGRMMTDALNARAEYCTSQREKFLKAAGEYHRAEEEARSAVNDQHGGIV